MALAGQTMPPARRVRGKVIAMMLVVVVLFGGAAALYFLVLPADMRSNIVGLLSPSTGGDVTTVQNFVDLDEIVVAINAEGSRQRFLKVSITLEIPAEKDVPLVNELRPLIIDSYQFFLRELRIEELQGSSGLYTVKEELLARTNLIVSPAQVRDVLFRDFLIQ